MHSEAAECNLPDQMMQCMAACPQLPESKGLVCHGEFQYAVCAASATKRAC